MENKVKAIRESQHLTQQELARRSGISRATISGLECETLAVTTTETLIKIADALGKKVSEIFFV